MKNLKIRQINFHYDKEIVEVFYKIDDLHYLTVFSFTVWADNNCFNEKDLQNLMVKYPNP